VTAYMAGARAGTKKQKNRAAVRGGGRKPFRQKGLGRARAGTIRSPIWRGGGVTFAAKNRDFSQKVNRKMYRGAMRSILSELIRQDRLVVIDDPTSILKCTNKVYLNELLTLNGIPTPHSVTFRKNEQEKLASLSFPYVLKLPDGAFSQGVKKVNNQEELNSWLREFFLKTDLLIAQEYMPSQFDWRVGILNGKVLYVCKYYMAKGHWQIIEWKTSGRTTEGDSENIAVEKAPKKLLSLALKAAKLIGNGLYGVDVKELDGKFYVIEVNDNPSIDAGVEDRGGSADIYKMIMQHMMDMVLMNSTNE